MADIDYNNLLEVAEAKVDGGVVSAGKALDAMTRLHAKANTPTPTTDVGRARAAIESLSSSSEWRQRFFSGDQTARREFSELTAKVVAGDQTAAVMAGDPLPAADTIELTGSVLGGRIPARALASEVASLRSAGISDGAVQQLLDGYAMSPSEVEAATRYKSMRLGDAEFTARYLAGEWSAVREMRLLAMILSAPRRAA
jgi:hypothetical protein